MCLHNKFRLNSLTVGKHTPCKLSFVYTSYISVRAAPKFGKHASIFLYNKGTKYIQAIICSEKWLSSSNT